MTLLERPAPGKYRLRVEDYERLADAGAFGDARTELIAGDVIVMSAEHRPHAWAKDELHYRIRRALEDLGGDLRASSGSVAVSDHDMPLPDIVLNRAPRGRGAIPLADVALVIEVSSTTLAHDIRRKVNLYARSGIPEYWVVDLGAGVIHQMWNPLDEAYAERREVAFGERIAAQTIAGLAVETAELG